MYDPIKQDVILLANARSNVAAQALMQYLRSDKAREIILSYGYGL
jgi:molybdate transport system substrate-binding protein